MSREIEQHVKRFNPVEVTGLDIQKVQSAVWRACKAQL